MMQMGNLISMWTTFKTSFITNSRKIERYVWLKLTCVSFLNLSSLAQSNVQTLCLLSRYWRKHRGKTYLLISILVMLRSSCFLHPRNRFLGRKTCRKFPLVRSFLVLNPCTWTSASEDLQLDVDSSSQLIFLFCNDTQPQCVLELTQPIMLGIWFVSAPAETSASSVMEVTVLFQKYEKHSTAEDYKIIKSTMTKSLRIVQSKFGFNSDFTKMELRNGKYKCHLWSS